MGQTIDEILLKNVNTRVKSETDYPETKLEYKLNPLNRQVAWSMVFRLTVGHILMLWSVYKIALVISWLHMIYVTVSIVITLQGVTLASHRYYSHRAFKANFPLQIFLMILQTLTAQDSIHRWARDHRVHHKYSDTDADPYTSRHGLFFAHIGWLMVKKHPLVSIKGKGIDVSDLENDPIVMFQKKYYYQLCVLLNIAPMIVPVYFLEESWLDAFLVSTVFRTGIVLHYLGIINSIAHTYGTRPYDKNIQPGDVRPFWYLYGEGYHNYHHVFPSDYRSSEQGTPFNLSGTLIDVFAYFGWATNLKTASPEVIAARARRTGDGTPLIKQDARNAAGY